MCIRDSGISTEGEIIDLGVENNLIEKSGSWYSYDGDRIGQGKENVREYLIENPKIKEEIKKKILDTMIPSASKKKNSTNGK